MNNLVILMMKKWLLLLLLFMGIYSQAQKIPSYKIEELVKLYTNTSDTVYVINFWATFCKPCVEEIPYLIKISKKYAAKKVKLTLVSLDLASFYPAKLKAFVKKNKYNVPVAWLNETNADVFCPQVDTAWSGVIPATLIVNNLPGYRKFFEEQLSPEKFELELKQALGVGD